MTEGICDFALQLKGPERKTGYDYGRKHKTHDKTGVTIHTAEYDVAQWDEKVLYNALFSGREASWHFTITKEGWLFQHYPVNATTWHCGYDGNLWTVGIECEGYAPNKISGPQYELLVWLLKWIKGDRGVAVQWHRGNINAPGLGDWGKATLWEHKDWMNTLCQVFTRGMIDADQLIRDLKGEEPMPEPFTEEQEKRLETIIKYSKPGLEAQARLAVGAACLAAAGAAFTGDWKNLERNVAGVKTVAEFWSRWEG